MPTLDIQRGEVWDRGRHLRDRRRVAALVLVTSRNCMDTAAEAMGCAREGGRPGTGHRLDGRVLGRERRAAARPVFHRRRCATVGKLSWLVWTLVHRHGLHPILHLRGDRRAVSGQGRRHLHLRRHRLGSLREARRSGFRVVQLVRLVAGAGHRFGAGRGVHSHRHVRAGFGGEHLATDLLDLERSRPV